MFCGLQIITQKSSKAQETLHCTCSRWLVNTGFQIVTLRQCF